MKNNPPPFAAPGFLYEIDNLCALLVDGMPDPVLAIDGSHRILLANPAAGRWLGAPRKQLLQQPLLRMLPAGDTESLLSFLDRCLAGTQSGFSQLFELGGRYFQWTVHAMLDRAADLHGALCLLQDRSEEERLRRQVRQQQRLLQQNGLLLRSRAQLAGSLIDASPGPTFVLDRAQRFCAANRQYLEYTGRSNDDLMGRTLLESFPEAAGTVFYEKMLDALAGAPQYLEQIPCVLNDGYCNIQLTPLSYEGFVYGVLIVAEMATT
ncbi:PAS domain-containing protein [Flaviaesturariibacter terrae]